ncbi:hypothetical protein DKG75_18735 [Zavarzinia compransoris]|uniref:Uncharacterized protein n=2 Tax=Zavarzinia compransoris TaxID=1264899 RepID=A0A317E1I0_9PROT|nr:hypothetical protein DKG75_18735 [Zavarzinia compransoris]
MSVPLALALATCAPKARESCYDRLWSPLMPLGGIVDPATRAAACVILAMDKSDIEIVSSARQQALETGKPVARTYDPAPGAGTTGKRSLRVGPPVPAPDREGFTMCRHIHTDFSIKGVEGKVRETALICRDADGDDQIVDAALR